MENAKNARVCIFLCGSIVVFPAISSADTADCSLATAYTSGCPVVIVTLDPEEVTLDGTIPKPDAGSGDSSAGSWDDSGASRAGAGGAGAGSPNDATTPAIVRDGYTVTAALTLTDIAKFRPNAGTDSMQPNGWMIVGLSTNFFAHATQHIKSGTLLGGPASVRFTPVQYSWTYGDGATRTTSTPGATWSAQGIAEFDATPTSHIYSAPGRYVIDLTIGYAPEYQLASGTAWIPVSGVVWAPANQLVAVAAAGAKTVLVEDECTVNPGGPGC